MKNDITISSLEDPEVNRWNQQAWARHLGREIDIESLRVELTSGTLTEAFDKSAERLPEKLALTIDDRSVTHGEIRTLSTRAAGWLQKNGIRGGERVLLCGTNSIDLVLAYVATLRAGGVVVSCSPGATEREIERIINLSRPVVALGNIEHLEMLRSVPITIRPRTIAPMSVASRGGFGEFVPVSVESDDLAALAFTSGTTGEPKAACLSHANQLATIRGAMMAWRWSEKDVLVHALPLSHGHGLGGLHATLLSGSSAIILSRFDADRLCETIQENSATVLFAVPTIYRRLIDSPKFTRARLSNLRLPISGSASLSPSLAREVAEALGVLPLERYGTTETGLDISNPYEGERKPGSVGFPLPSVEMAIIDDDGIPINGEVDGEILLRGPQVFRGYLGREAEGFLPGGWFRTGDVGRVDLKDGHVSITGRLKDMIITGGLNVYPREVELVLEEHASILESAVVGIPSEAWGEEVTAFIVTNSEAVDLTEVTGFVKKRLAAYKVPKRILAVQTLPRNSLGKIMKSELLNLAQSETSQLPRGASHETDRQVSDRYDSLHRDR